MRKFNIFSYFLYHVFNDSACFAYIFYCLVKREIK